MARLVMGDASIQPLKGTRTQSTENDRHFCVYKLPGVGFPEKNPITDHSFLVALQQQEQQQQQTATASVTAQASFHIGTDLPNGVTLSAKICAVCVSLMTMTGLILTSPHSYPLLFFPLFFFFLHGCCFSESWS